MANQNIRNARAIRKSWQRSASNLSSHNKRITSQLSRYFILSDIIGSWRIGSISGCTSSFFFFDPVHFLVRRSVASTTVNLTSIFCLFLNRHLLVFSIGHPLKDSPTSDLLHNLSHICHSFFQKRSDSPTLETQNVCPLVISRGSDSMESTLTEVERGSLGSVKMSGAAASFEFVRFARRVRS